MTKGQRIIKNALRDFNMFQSELGTQLEMDQSAIAFMLSGRRIVRKVHVLAIECLYRRRGIIKGKETL